MRSREGGEKATKWWSDTGSRLMETAEVPQDLMNGVSRRRGEC